MTIKIDGTWPAVGTPLRERLRDEYELHGEECFYVDTVSFQDHRPTDWDDHSAIHAVQIIVNRQVSRGKDVPGMREVIKEEFAAHKDSYNKEFEDERDQYADRKAIVALRGLHKFIMQER